MSLTEAERRRLERQRDRIMKVLQESDAGADGPSLNADERQDLEREWQRIDVTLQGDGSR